MEAGKLRELREAAPFKPFKIDLADGRQVLVLHRDYISISPEGRTCVVWQKDDSMSIIDVRLVQSVSIEPATGTEAA